LLSNPTIQALLEFRHARRWEQFHTPRNLAAAISVEAAELLETFVWATDQEVHGLAQDHRTSVADEVADIAILLTYLATDLGIDIESAVKAKILQNAKKYPVEKSRGVNKKYSEL
jgi:NTP pyrophosphatase (non-canonical NTP hydrolase)